MKLARKLLKVNEERNSQNVLKQITKLQQLKQCVTGTGVDSQISRQIREFRIRLKCVWTFGIK